LQRERNKSVSKNSFWLLVFGFAFFINPVPLGLDLIPDVFGCLLIYFGLTQLAYFDGMVETARRFTFYLFIVEFIKLFSMRAIFLSSISSNRLLAVTAFSIAQGFIYIVLFRQLFGGISYFAMRNNANESMKLCDNASFLTFLAFTVRVLATFLPELLALFDILLYDNATVNLDFSDFEMLESLVSSKVILVVLLNLVSFVTSIFWFVALYKLLRTFRNEIGNELDIRYSAEYSSRPEMVRPKKLRYGSYAVYVSIFFSLDIVFDDIRIIPASFMFFGLFFAALMLKDFANFKKVFIFSPLAFVFLLGAEIHHVFLVPYGAVYVEETPILTVITGALIAVIFAILGLLCMRYFLIAVKSLQKSLGGSEIDIGASWASYCVLVTLWSLGYVVPYFYSYFATLRFFAACVFIWQVSKMFVRINDEEYERFIMLGK
jgi:hypothetical protein